ncbi:MAG TPA: hypothetical protein VJX66_17545, partial [Amycolatopsis sp.]|nr:hypothetical protein [Amycolatopsis sp.]
MTSLQTSAEQTLLSLQLLVVPTQRTGSVPVQWSSTVQNSPSSQEAVLGWNWSAGHNALVPVHFSSTSHWPAAIRQTVLLGAKASAGQSGPEPVQFSAASQGPAAGRQTVLLGSKASAGQSGPEPVQFSAASQ